MSRKRAREFQELRKRFGASFDRETYKVTLQWPCTDEFRREACRKLRARCSRVVDAYYTSGCIILKLSESHARSDEALMKPILYELQRIVKDQKSARMERRATKRRRRSRYKNKQRAKGRYLPRPAFHEM